MCIDIADAKSEQLMVVDEIQHFLVRGDDGLRHEAQVFQNKMTLPQIAEGQFADYEGMYQDLSGLKQLLKRRVALAQVVAPYRRIDVDQADLDRRRRGATNLRSPPPKRAKRRALSRSINALSASRTSADFSVTPVKA
jgi:hypothetical protein